MEKFLDYTVGIFACVIIPIALTGILVIVVKIVKQTFMLF